MLGHREVPQKPTESARIFCLLPYKHGVPVSPLESALLQVLILRHLKPSRINTSAKTKGGPSLPFLASRPQFTQKGTSYGSLGFLSLALLLVASARSTKAQQAAPPTAEQLAAISQRGRLLYEYDQAAWYATDAVQMPNPKAVEGQRYVAKKEDGKWTVVFGKLNDNGSRFDISYEADEQATLRAFEVRKEPAERQDEGFFLFAERAIEVAMKDFGGVSRPYNVAVLPTAADQLYVYLYPAQTKARVYPLGGAVKYLLNADGKEILEKRQMHKTIVENPPSRKARKVVVGYHTHVLSDQPEDSDVFHVLTQDPPVPEMILTPHFMYKVMTDGTIRIEKERKRKK